MNIDIESHMSQKQIPSIDKSIKDAINHYEGNNHFEYLLFFANAKNIDGPDELLKAIRWAIFQLRASGAIISAIDESDPKLLSNFKKKKTKLILIKGKKK